MLIPHIVQLIVDCKFWIHQLAYKTILMLFWQHFCGGAICVANLRNILIFNKISILSCGFNRLDWVRVHVPLWNMCTKNSSNNSVSMSRTTNIYHLLLVVHGKPYWPREKHEVLMTHMALFSFLISQVIIWIENLLNYTLISRIPMNNKDTNSITMMRPHNKNSFEINAYLS